MQPTISQYPSTLPGSLTGALFDHAERIPDAPALASSDGRLRLTWAEYADVAARTAAGLAAVGVRPGETVALLMGNEPEWQITDLGALLVGATPFSLYATAPPAQNADLLVRAGARALVADASLLEGLIVPKGVAVVGLEDGTGVDLTFAELQRLGDGTTHDSTVDDDRVATLIFTSGTTGPPKAVEISHESILFMAGALHSIRPLTAGRHVSYLPHAHIVDRLTGHYLPLLSGSSTVTVANPMAIFDELPTIRPTFFTSVPRIWQRLESRLRSAIDVLPAGDRDDVLASIAGQDAGGPEAKGALPGTFARIREQVGLDQTDWLLTGSAPLPAETHRFFAGLGMPLHDCWGLTETTAVATVMTPEAHEIGTVGRPLPGTEVVLASDGEILVRGPHVTRGYRGDPEATARAFDDDGWFRTGDLGRWEGANLVLVGRKKEMMISSGGENMSPIRIESALTSSSSLIKDAVVVGDGRPFNVALLVPDIEVAARDVGAGEAGAIDPADLALVAALQAAVDQANNQLTRAERVRRFVVVGRDWSLANGEITPTLKLRRTGIESTFRAQIEELYTDDGRT